MDFDLADPSFWAQSPEHQHAAFAYLRRLEKPVFVTETPARRGKPARGYWAIVKHKHVSEVSKNAKVFSSEPGVTTPLPNPLATFVFGNSMVNMDNPKHGRMRAIVQRAFSTSNIQRIQDDVERVVDVAVTDLITNKPDDFVRSAASEVPFQVLANMMGVPQKGRERILDEVFETTERTAADHAFKRIRIPGRGTIALARMHLMMAKITRDTRKNPQDDILTALVTTEIDGQRLGYRDLGAFFNLLLSAGIETTRNEIVHFLDLMTRYPEQKQLLLDDFDRYIDGAIEEVIRYEPSIFQFRRHVTQPYELGGVEMKKGDAVVIYFHSANRDEEVFENPDVFDITREPNPHVGFGAGGPHVCLGKLLARSEMRTLYRELFRRVPNIRAEDNPPRFASNFDNRIVRMSFTF